MIAYPMAAVWIDFESFGRSLVVLWQRLEESERMLRYHGLRRGAEDR